MTTFFVEQFMYVMAIAGVGRAMTMIISTIYSIIRLI